MNLNKSEETMRLRLQLAQTKSYLDMQDVMLLSGYSYSTIMRRIESGSLKAFQNVPKGKILLKKEDVTRWIENGAR